MTLREQSHTRMLTIIAQDPSVRNARKEIIRATVEVPAEDFAPGPWGYRVHVVDYDSSSNLLYRPLKYDRPGNGLDVDPFENASDEELLTNPNFHSQNVYSIVMMTLARFEFALGRRVSWSFYGHQIKVAPHAFADANAFYSEADQALLFGYFPGSRALDYAPPVDLEFSDFLSAVLTSDREINPTDAKYKFRKTLRESFAGYGIMPAGKGTTIEPGIWESAKEDEFNYGRTHLESIQRDRDEVFRFIWDNRKALHLYEGAYSRVLSVRPCLRIGPDGFALRETVAEYMQMLVLDAKELRALQIALPKGMPADQQITLYGGGALVFNEYGRLKYHINNRIDNLKNTSAVRNLMTMGKRHVYVHYGSKSGLETILPGVKTLVLGPPNLKQSQEIRKQRSNDPDEFWNIHAQARFWSSQARAATAVKTAAGAAKPLFPDATVYSDSAPPPFARWFMERMRKVRGNQLLGIMRALDGVMNNTSVILLFEAGGKKFLFPGDAQIENWSFALSKPEIRELLKEVNLYKVGHHGSRNATPMTLWNLFKNRSEKKRDPNRLKAVLSTMAGKHGRSEATAVPRKTLVEALETFSACLSTQQLKGKTKIAIDDEILHFDLQG